MGVFREALKNADMETKKKIAMQATVLGLDLGNTIDCIDCVLDVNMEMLRRNMETAGLTIVEGKYQEIRADQIQVVDNDIKIYKKDPEE